MIVWSYDCHYWRVFPGSKPGTVLASLCGIYDIEKFMVEKGSV